MILYAVNGWVFIFCCIWVYLRGVELNPITKIWRELLKNVISVNLRLQSFKLERVAKKATSLTKSCFIYYLVKACAEYL